MRTLIVTAALAAFSLGFAASLDDAIAALDKGDAQSAVDTALSLNSADGYALAAKATTLSAALAPDSQRQGLFEKAVSYANKAIALDPNNANAHFELARADGRLAQYKGVLQSLGLAGEVKGELNRAIALDPKLAGAYVALGLWNAEVPFIAGGNKGQVQPNFDKAISLEPTVITHRLEYANALMTISKRNKQNAIGVLERAVVLTPRNFWEARDLETAKKMLADLKK